MKQLPPNWTSGLVPFTAASQDCLERNGAVPGAYMLANVSKDGTMGWVARGAALEVFMASSGQRLGVWTFGAALKDVSTAITALTEYSYDGAPRLLVATTSATTQTGMLCVFDIKTSKVIKAIEVPYKITAIEPVTSVGADQAPAQVLSEHLRCFCGVIAVGTHNGHIYMIDLNLDDESDGSDEVCPNSVLFLDPRVRDVASRRFSAISKRRHLCLELDGESHQRGYYYFRKPDNSVLKTYLSDELCVSSLLYMRQTASLVVGFNFGCFQLWGLYTPVLEYTSRLTDNLSPITHFSYQEPENDPRNFVYIWVARGPMPMDPVDEQTASMSLFQLGYDKRVWHEGLGHVYEDLLSVGPRFEHFLTTNPYSTAEDSSMEYANSRVVCCYTIQDTSYTVPERSDQEDSFDDASGGPDLSHCAFVWEAAPADPAARSQYHLAVFDMNRWYHAQMPHVLRCAGLTHHMCPFMAFYSLDSVSHACGSSDIMALHVNASSLARYKSCVVPAPEHHLYPSSLAFEAVAISESGLVLMRFLGHQRQVIADLLRGGPELLVDPAGAYGLCLCAGLLPRAAESMPTATVPAGEKRLAVMDVMLDHNQVNFLTACVHAWGTGEFSGAGCTLRCILDWAWARVGVMKESMNRLCVSLFDWSGLLLDAAALTLLHQHQVALQHLGLVMTTMLSGGISSTQQGRGDLETKVMVVSLIDSHLGVLIWSVMEGFLPEVGEDEAPSETRYAFPYGQLKGYFTQRRAEVSRLNSELHGTELLMIDGVLEQAGMSLQELWENEGGAGTYPPPSMHALLNMFLLESVPLVVKHSIFFYLLCDLMYLTPEETTERFEQKMHHFTQTFSLSYATIRLVQGFWHLDRKEFEEAMLFLLDPIIRSELSPWQHTRIVKALLYQGHHKMALKYIRVKKPPMVTPVDVKLRLTVLLANGLTAEAFEYQRKCRDQGNMEDLLSHLFLGCQQTKTMDQLLQLPLSADEERHLVSHMKTTTEPHATEVLVLHYLQRARFIEALSLNSKIKHSSLGDVDTMARERSLARQSIVDCYHRILPRAQRKLAFGVDMAMKRGASSRREVARPVPLSVFVNRAKRSAAVSHATLISTVLEKVREVKDYGGEPQPSTSDAEPVSLADRHPGPFMCTPVTARTRSKINEAVEVVYPSIKSTEFSPHPVFAPSPQKSSYGGGSPFTTMLDSLHPTNFSGSKRQRRITNAAALSLLQTPPVRRRTPSMAHLSAPHSASTPQSILKIRHTARHTESPLTAKSATFTEQSVAEGLHRKLNMDLTADPPSALSGSTFRTILSSTVCSSTSTTSTPKQLRFSVPGSPDSTPDDRSSSTPSPQPPNVEVSMRSVRDRSPTPERNSPKASPKMDVVRGRKERLAAHDIDVAMETDDDVRVTFQMDEAQDIVMEEPDNEECDVIDTHAGQGDYEAVSTVTKHYAEQEEDHMDELTDVIVLSDDVNDDVDVDEDDAEVSKVSSCGISVHYEEMSGTSDDEDQAESVKEGLEGECGLEVGDEECGRPEVEKPALKRYYAEQEEPVVHRYYAEQEEPVVHRYYQEQEDPVVHHYYQEQESDVEIKDSEESTEVRQVAVSDQTNSEISADVNSTTVAHSEHLAVSEALPMVTQSIESRVVLTANSLVVDLCDSKKSSTDSDTLESNATDSSDSQSVSTSCSGGDAPSGADGSMVGTVTTTSHVSLSSNSGVENGESDSEQQELHLDDVDDVVVDILSDIMSEVVNGDAGSEETLVSAQEEERVWTGSEGDASSVASSSNMAPMTSSSISVTTTMSTTQVVLMRPERLKLSAVEAPEFKTPPRPTRSTSMPPTPPESGQGTPPQETSPPKIATLPTEQPTTAVVPTRGPLTRQTRGQSHMEEEISVEVVEEEEERPGTPPRSTRASTRATTPTRATTSPRITRATTPPRTTRATTPPRTTRATTPPRTTRATTPPRTTRATTPPRSTRATTPEQVSQVSTPQATRATTPQQSTRATTPEQVTHAPQRAMRATTPQRTTRASTPQRTMRATTPELATTPERATRATTPQRSTRATTPQRATRATTPQRITRATTPSLETSPPLNPITVSQASTSPVRSMTPTRVTRSHAGDKPAEEMDIQVALPKTQKRRSKGSQHSETELLTVPKSTRASRSRADSTSDTKSITIDDSDSVSVASTVSRRSRGRPSSRSSSPVMGDVTGNVTPPRTEAQEVEVMGRVTRSGGRLKTATQKRMPTRRTKKEADGEGLLSSQSFMMRTRQGSISREGTPEPTGGTAVSDISSTVTEDDIVERTSFTFAEPMAVDTSKDTPDVVTVTPASSFLFSPPLTRTRSRATAKSTKSERDLKSKVKVISILPDVPTDLVKVITSKKITKRTAKKVKSLPANSPSDSVINFLSPYSEDDNHEDLVEPRRRVLPKKPTSLRPKRVAAKKRGMLKFW